MEKSDWKNGIDGELNWEDEGNDAPIYTLYFSILKDGEEVTKTTRIVGSGSRLFDDTEGSIWDWYNAYAKSHGYRKQIENEKYLGQMAWGNKQGSIMELVQTDKRQIDTNYYRDLLRTGR